MAKIFIYPATSLILTDMVTRFGHTPLSFCDSCPGTHPDRRTRISTAPDHPGRAKKRAPVGSRRSPERGAGAHGALWSDD